MGESARHTHILYTHTDSVTFMLNSLGIHDNVVPPRWNIQTADLHVATLDSHATCSLYVTYPCVYSCMHHHITISMVSGMALCMVDTLSDHKLL